MIKYVFINAQDSVIKTWYINDLNTKIISIYNIVNNSSLSTNQKIINILTVANYNNKTIVSLLNDPNAKIYLDTGLANMYVDDSKSAILNYLENNFNLSSNNNITFLDFGLNGNYTKDSLNTILTQLNNSNSDDLINNTESETTSTIKDTIIDKTDDKDLNLNDNLSEPINDTDIKPNIINSNIIKKNKYSYLFGLDKANFYKRNIKQECCFVSQNYHLNDLDKINYITLEANYLLSEYSSIEFYIIDGSNTIPILDSSQKIVQKEKIFKGTLPNFNIDMNYPYIIYKDNLIINDSIENIINKNDGLYYITYTPKNGYSYKPINNDIKIKAILRLYDINYDSPILSGLYLKVYGGDSVWQENI